MVAWLDPNQPHTSSTAAEPGVNRLARERSPYLLQHARNPVDWYPWGDEAFARARNEDKPIFLSIGYSTCHWCHVMEHESFENPAIAQLLNADFVSIKVDREERPGRRSRLHGVRAGDDRSRRMADVGLPDAGAQAVLRRHLLSAVVAVGTSGVLGSPRRDRPRAGRRIARRVDHAAAELLDRLKGVTGTDGRSRAEAAVAGVGCARRGRGAVPDGVRPSPRRLRQRAEVPAAVRVAPAASRVRAPGRGGSGTQAPLLMASETLAGDGARRDARPYRRRLPPLLGRRGMAGAALREDALRPGAAGARVSRGVSGDRQTGSSRTSPRTRSTTCCAI